MLIDTSRIPARFAARGVDVTLGTTIGGYDLPTGLVAVTGRKRG